jgi:hypothetical protein
VIGVKRNVELEDSGDLWTGTDIASAIGNLKLASRSDEGHRCVCIHTYARNLAMIYQLQRLRNFE